MNTWGQRIKLSIFGESHGPAVGVVIDGIPAGEAFDTEEIRGQMNRRKPGGALATKRQEADEWEFLSGIKVSEGKLLATGAPICAVIRNTDVLSKDYGELLRPSHADWTALIKYKGFADTRGGGHFSGRLAAPLTLAGALARQILARKKIAIFGKLASVAKISDGELTDGEFRELCVLPFPAKKAKEMGEEIERAREEGDSVGAVVEVRAFNVPAGLGEPFFYSLESALAALLFSIPAVKGVEFGGGFAVAGERGSSANDQLEVKEGRIHSTTNNAGGILGGITNGMPLTFKVAFKPTPSIAKPQRTVNPKTLEETELVIKGRHDPCVALRAVPVCEAACALVLMDFAEPATGNWQLATGH